MVHGQRRIILVILVVLSCALGPLAGRSRLVTPAMAGDPSLLLNGSFEEGAFAATGSPTGWTRDIFDPTGVLTWDDTQAHEGGKSIKIDAPMPNDARWIQTVAVQPHTLYRLSGWIKTENVAHSSQAVDAGANLALMGEWTRSNALIGTHDWTYVTLFFNSKEKTAVTIGARLGFWSGTTTGAAWFDEIQLTPFTPTGPHPSWKILVLIYTETDFTFTDKNGVVRHVVATMHADESARAAESARLFVEEDIPALNSGNMIPTLTIRYPDHALTQLSPARDGWSPTPQDTAPDRDPAFDAVIVIWDPRVTDVNSGESLWIGAAAGLTYGMGSEQTYLEMIIEGAAIYNHRNVFKHEWGHAILGYYDAIGVSPQPTVSNHANPGDYVHCPTGTSYVWEDETIANPIPNSIYNNDSGFTHDYYSGSIATWDQPTRCLGITPLAWATGGPVSKPTGTTDEVFDLLVSSTSSGKVQGIKFNDEDILRYSLAAGAWQLFFDGSDVGVRGDVNALAVAPDGNLLLSFNSRQTLAGLGEVDDSDIVKFISTSLGAHTAGTFAWYFDGSDVDLTTDGEDVDAIGFSADNRLLISTLGDIKVNNQAGKVEAGKNEDLFAFRPAALGEATAGQWAFYFDGSDVKLNKQKGELSGVWVDPDNGDLYLGTRGRFAVEGLSGDGSDIFICDPASLGEETACAFRSFWLGESAGFGKETIDAFTFIPTVALPINAATLDASDTVDEDQEPDSEDADDFTPEEEAEEESVRQVFLPTVMR